jgi:hypothetical protein
MSLGSIHSSDGCQGSADNALSIFVASPSCIEKSSSDDGWGHPGDALACFLDPEEGPLDALGSAGDIPEPTMADPWLSNRPHRSVTTSC